jgi:hypothetical protein
MIEISQGVSVAQEITFSDAEVRQIQSLPVEKLDAGALSPETHITFLRMAEATLASSPNVEQIF